MITQKGFKNKSTAWLWTVYLGFLYFIKDDPYLLVNALFAPFFILGFLMFLEVMEGNDENDTTRN